MVHSLLMEIVSKRTHQVLSYIAALDSPDVLIPVESVNEYGANPNIHVDKGDWWDTANTLSGLARRQRAFDLGFGIQENYSDFLARFGWIEIQGGSIVRITELGKALLRHLNKPVIDTTSNDLVEVVTDPDNPFAYADALDAVTSAENSLLVDPYLRLDELRDIADFRVITRVLIGHKLKLKDYTLMSHGLAGLLNAGNEIEIRKSTALHDRYLIPPTGNVVMLGSSLNGIQKNICTFTTLGTRSSEALRSLHEEIWNEAERIEPTTSQQRGPAEETAKPTES